MAPEIALHTEIAGTELEVGEEDIQTLSEEQILQRVKQGDKEAYRHIVTRYMTRAYSIALGFVHNHQDALDLSQDCFIKVFRKLKSYDTRRPFFPWMYEVLKNLCLDHLRRRKTKAEIPLEGLQVVKAEKEDREMKIVVWRGINSLPADQKEIILLRHFQQLSYKEIADLTGKPIGTVMSSLYYARARLREIMEKYLGRDENRVTGSS